MSRQAEFKQGAVVDILKQAGQDGADLNALATKIHEEYLPTRGKKAGSFKKLDVGKDTYQQAKEEGLTLSQFLEKEDPSANYEPGCGTAFQRQLAARGLEISGPNAISLDQFFDIPQNRVLFPEFINTQIQVGRLGGRFTLLPPDITSIETQIDGLTEKVATLDETQDMHMKPVGEMTKFPRLTIKHGESSIDLVKYGVLLAESYEHMRRISAPKMALVLRLIGRYIGLDEAEDGVTVLINGDGNSNAAVSGSASGAAGSITYTGLVDFWGDFLPSYESTLFIVNKASLLQILKLVEFKDPLVGGRFISEGALVTPFGNRLKLHENSNSALLNQKILGVDGSVMLERLTERGSQITETDKIIDGQWTETTISFYAAWAKLDKKSAVISSYA